MTISNTTHIATTAELAHPIHEPLARRWSPNGFDSNRSISTSEVQKLFEAARWTPSSYNAQPWRYLYAYREDQKEFEVLLDTLSPKNQPRAKDAALLILAVAQRIPTGREQENHYAMYDLGAANFALTVQATELGLSVHQMAGFSRTKVREGFEIAPDYEPVVVMAVGFQPEVSPKDLSLDQVPRKPRLTQETFAQRLKDLM